MLPKEQMLVTKEKPTSFNCNRPSIKHSYNFIIINYPAIPFAGALHGPCPLGPMAASINHSLLPHIWRKSSEG
jgi:hypothetical protein